jgi:hypothetical protein
MTKPSYSELREARKKAISEKVVAIATPAVVVKESASFIMSPPISSATVISPEVVEQVKQKLKEEKLAEQKQKKRDYQREYMREYKKDIPVDEGDKLKRKVKRSLSGIDPAVLKPILDEILAEK